MKKRRKRATHPGEKPPPRAGSKKSTGPKKKVRRWSHLVTTVSTYPPEGLYAKDAKTIARVMASKRVSPKGIGSAIRMVQFYINRAGKNLAPERVEELEELLQNRLHKQRPK
jgi:tRNA(adenine34) deaminase